MICSLNGNTRNRRILVHLWEITQRFVTLTNHPSRVDFSPGDSDSAHTDKRSKQQLVCVQTHGSICTAPKCFTISLENSATTCFVYATKLRYLTSAESLRDGLKFVVSLDIILSGLLGSKRRLTNLVFDNSPACPRRRVCTRALIG